MLITIILCGIIGLILVNIKAIEFLNVIQIEEYDSEKYLNWIKENRRDMFILGKDDIKAKRSLVFTRRAKRLFSINILLNTIIISLAIFIISKFVLDISFYLLMFLFILYLGLISIIYLYQEYISLLSNYISSPIEKNINQGYYEKAKDKIKNKKDLIVIGVTGSFGKSSTKFVLETILKEKYKVLNTPESFNTPMGLSKVINDDLTEEHEIFIAELGAKNIGDIKELAELVQPNIGVITFIGSTNIETFINIDNIMKTKYELIEELSVNGLAVFNYDNEYIKKLVDKTFKEKKLYGIEDIEELDFYAENIEVSEKGSTFTIKDKEENSIECTTKLLGKHNIYNILAAVTIARSLDLSFEEIKRGIEKIKPVRHRLNIMTLESGIIVIDDAFNSNPIGAKAALEVLSECRQGNKIIVTPGMVDLGTMEEEVNKEFGINIGKVCDYAILLGEEQTKPIYEGLMEANFNEKNIIILEDKAEIEENIGKIANPKDIVLFVNDLPDYLS